MLEIEKKLRFVKSVPLNLNVERERREEERREERERERREREIKQARESE